MAGQTLRIDAQTLRARLAGAEAPRILDVRTPAEYGTAHIPGSYNVPLDTLREHRADLLGCLDEQVVLVCRSGQRATRAEQALTESGLTNVLVLDGGMIAWQTTGAPITRGRARWELERQVRLVAGSIVLVSVLASTVVPGLRWVAAAVGAGLAIAAITNTCAMGALLAKLPYNRGPGNDIAAILKQLTPAGRATEPRGTRFP